MELNSIILNAKCQSCGSELIYNPKLGCLTCKYCESNVFLPKQNDEVVLVRQYTSDFHPNQLNQALRAYKCKACGTVYYMSSEEKSQKCPNCGLISSEMVEDPGFCADGVIPFKLSKQEACTEFLKYVKKHGGATSEMKKDAKDNKIEGVFIPVWNFQFNIDASYSATATQLRKYSDGTYYSVYKPVYGEKHKRVKSLDQSATSTENEVFLQLFDEEDYKNIIPYTPEYSYGYKVDTIDRNIHDYFYSVTETAEIEMKQDIKKKVLGSYKEVSNLNVDCRASDVFFNFTYVPVYVSSYTKKGKNFKTFISGTTGKVVGHTPKTPGKIFGTLFKFALLIAFIILIIKICNS